MQSVTNKHAVILGRKGGRARAASMTADELADVSRKMNEARTAKLSPERRSEIARLAAAARHAGKRRKQAEPPTPTSSD